MSLLRTVVICFAIFILLHEEVSGRKKHSRKKQLVIKGKGFGYGPILVKKLGAQRAQIVKCCGRKRCSSVFSNNRGRTKSRNGTTLFDDVEPTTKGAGSAPPAEDAADTTAKPDEAPGTEPAAGDGETTAAAGPEGDTTAAGGGETSADAPASEAESTSAPQEGDTTAANSETAAGPTTVAAPPGSETTAANSSTAAPAANSTAPVVNSTLTTMMANSSTNASLATNATVPVTNATTTAPQRNSTCPVCEKNATLFSPSGQLLNATKYGYWKQGCDQVFLFGNKIVNWETNMKMCCSIGMVPISINSSTIRTCMNNLVAPATWTYNYNYWAGGKRGLDKSSFQWCPSESIMESSGSAWAANNPNSSLDCVQLKVVKNSPKVELVSKNCSNSLVFGCQGLTTPAPPCFKPVCPDMAACKIKEINFDTLADQKTKVLKSPSSFGQWKTVSGRTYMFSSSKATWADAITGCCEIGMKLLSIEYYYEYDSLRNIMATAPADEYWTSGSDTGCEGFFGWCSVNKLIRSNGTMWAAGEPSNTGGAENCVSAQMSAASQTLSDTDCSRRLSYVCEVRDTTNTTTNSEALMDECGALFNVTRDEAIQLLNTSDFSSVKLKCFIRCMGENGGFMLDGVVVDEAMVALIEQLSMDEASFQSNMEATSICNSKRGMDECDTAAMVFQCGQEKAPQLTADVINTVMLNGSSEVSPLTPVVPKCITDFPCVVDPVRENIFKNNLAPTDGVIFNLCGVKYFASNNMLSYSAAATLCCKYGLEMAWIPSGHHVICLVDSPAFPVSNRGQHHWLGTSRLNKAQFQWCSASMPFNVSGLRDAYPSRSSDPTMFLLSVRMGETSIDTATYLSQEIIGSTCRAFCR